MSIPGRLAVLALRPIAEGALPATAQTAGEAAIEPVKQFLVRHFTEQQTLFTDSLRCALDRSWKALEVALNGVLWLRQVANPDDKSVIDLLKSFVQQTEPEISRHEGRRRSALKDLKDARRKNYLSMPAVIADSAAPGLADGVARYAKFTDPEQLRKADRSALLQIGNEQKQAGYPHLAAVLLPAEGEPLLTVAARYFFRQAIETGASLAEAFDFAKREESPPKIEAGLEGLNEVLTYHARRLEVLLGNVPRTIIEPPIPALILKLEQEGHGAAHAELYQTIDDLRRRFNLTHERVQPLDSYAVHNVIDHKQILSVIDRFRALPENERRNRPALLNAIAQFELAIGDPAAASRDFHFAAAFLNDSAAKAAVFLNAHRAGLLQQDYTTALSDLLEAVRLDGRRVATFPVGKYIPTRILTSDEFSTLYLCKHKHTSARVVVKTFSTHDLQRDVDDVFNELKALDALTHPAIIHVDDCGYVDAAKRQRPFIVTDWFDGLALDQYVAANGPLSVDDLAAIAESVASALEAAHAKNVLHESDGQAHHRRRLRAALGGQADRLRSRRQTT